MNNRMSLRAVICFTLVLSLFLVCCVRLTMITSEPSYAQTATQNSTVSVKVANTRGNIFDCNGETLTSTGTKNIAVASPTPQVIMYLSSVLSENQKQTVLETLNKGKPAVIETDTPLNCNGIINLEVNEREGSSKICDHLLGYTDYSGHGVSGLEKIFDETLYSDEDISVRFFTDGTGKVLKGIEGEAETNEQITNSGIMTTIDKNIQLIVEKAAEKIDMGAVVVSEAGTGKIRAMVSRPDFDSSNIAEYLQSEKAPLINRCLMSYNVGSAFKPCVAAAGIESGNFGSFSNNCSGSFVTENNVFNCHKRSGHGVLDMKQALAQSCNTYFYNLGLMLGGEKIYEMATVFGFGYKKTLLDGLSTVSENITDKETLKNSSSAVANLSIGQGELLASPITMLSLYEAIACQGIYYPKTVIEGTVEQGVLTKAYESQTPTRAISKETADILKEYLVGVVENGTGTSAKPNTVSAAGKTATAQTGQKGENGISYEHSWFCGFFPVDEPKYIVCVLIENANLGNISGANIFKEIADSVAGLKGISG